MYSATGTFFVSALCAILLPYYVTGELKIVRCNVENISPGTVSLDELNIADKGVRDSKLTLNSELNPSTVAVHIIINDEDGNSVFEQNFDLCSMSSSDLFKGYFLSFGDPGFNEGNCPILAGTYNSDSFELAIDDAPQGQYSATFEVLDTSMLFRVNCNAEVK